MSRLGQLASVLACTFVLLLAGPMDAWPLIRRVPADYPTIQAAIDSADANDVVLVAPGTYDENLDTHGKYLTLLSEAGPEATIVDGGMRGRVLSLGGRGIVEGFTLRRGKTEGFAGGIYVGSDASVIIRDNVIEENIAGYVDWGEGGGIGLNLSSSSPQLIERNVIRNNFGGYQGGGIWGGGAHGMVEIRDNLITGNYAHVCGGALYVGPVKVIRNVIAGNATDFSYGAGLCGSPMEVSDNTIVANTSGLDVQEVADAGTVIARNIVVSNRGFGLECASWKNSARIECNDVWGNGADWRLVGTCDSTGGRNLSADPLFCDANRGNFTPSIESPCAPQNNSLCGQIGARAVGCGVTDLRRASWGSLKIRYR